MQVSSDKQDKPAIVVPVSDICCFTPSAADNIMHLCLDYFSELCATFTAAQLFFFTPAYDSPSLIHCFSLCPSLIVHISFVKSASSPSRLCPSSYPSVLQSCALAPKSLLSSSVPSSFFPDTFSYKSLYGFFAHFYVIYYVWYLEDPPIVGLSSSLAPTLATVSGIGSAKDF